MLARALAVKCGIDKITEYDGTVRFELTEIHPNALTILDKNYPRARIKLEPGRKLALSAILPKTERTTDFLFELLAKFAEILAAQTPAAG